MYTQPLTLTAFSSTPRAAMLSNRVQAGELGGVSESSFAGGRETSQPVDVLDISAEGDAESRRLEAEAKQQSSQGEQSESGSSEASSKGNAEKGGGEANARPAESRPAGFSNELSEEELQVIAELQSRDAEVRAHEAAHQAVGGSYAGSASYSYQTGPDGQQYAIGGEVGISTGKASTPEATISKARQIRAAALAPADPSSQDLKVAAAASQMESVAYAEKLSQAEQERKQEKTPATAEGETDETSEEPSSFSVVA